MTDELSAELKAKYPTAKYAPLPDCKRCHGKGERYIESPPHSFIKEGWRPCMCIFIEHRHIPLVSDVIYTVVEQEKARMMEYEDELEESPYDAFFT
jgi:hypothetical protein